MRQSGCPLVLNLQVWWILPALHFFGKIWEKDLEKCNPSAFCRVSHGVCLSVHAFEAKCKENVLWPYKVLPRITISTLAQENGMSRIPGFLFLVGLICSLRNFQMAFSSVAFTRCQKLMERAGIKTTAPVVGPDPKNAAYEACSLLITASYSSNLGCRHDNDDMTCWSWLPCEALVSTGWISRIAFHDMWDVWVGCPKNGFAGWGIAEERNCHTDIRSWREHRRNSQNVWICTELRRCIHLVLQTVFHGIVFEVNDWKGHLASMAHTTPTSQRCGLLQTDFSERQVKSHFWIL